MNMITIPISKYCNVYVGKDKPSDFSDSKHDDYVVPVYANGTDNDGLVGYTTVATIKDNAVTVAARGSIGATFYRDEPFVPIVRLLVIVPDGEYLDAQYLYYVLQNMNIEGIGSVQKQLTKPDLDSKEIYIFEDVNYQKQIASVLSNIDRKIALNNSIRTDLESMAKQIYDYWFIQFDFPNENGEPYKSSGGKMIWNEKLKRDIPEGWEVKSLGEIVNESDKSKIQVNGAKEVGVYPFFTSGSTILALDDYFVDDFHCFLSTGGFPEVKGYKGKCAYSTDTWCIDADIYSYVLYQFLMSIKGQMETLLFAGTGLKHLQKDKFKSLCIVTPPSDLMVKFNTTMNSIWDKKTVSLTENNDLTKLRNFLLPMLMNGQIKIGA